MTPGTADRPARSRRPDESVTSYEVSARNPARGVNAARRPAALTNPSVSGVTERLPRSRVSARGREKVTETCARQDTPCAPSRGLTSTTARGRGSRNRTSAAPAVASASTSARAMKSNGRDALGKGGSVNGNRSVEVRLLGPPARLGIRLEGLHPVLDRVALRPSSEGELGGSLDRPHATAQGHAALPCRDRAQGLGRQEEPQRQGERQRDDRESPGRSVLVIAIATAGDTGNGEGEKDETR